MAVSDAQQAPRVLGVPCSYLGLARALGDHVPLPQAQACLLLQKALPLRELRLCFDDPEWEQLMGQILAKVTEVTAAALPLSQPHQEWCSGTHRDKSWDLSLVLGHGCPGRHCLPRGLGLWCGKWLWAAVQGGCPGWLSLATFSLEPAGSG